MSNILFVATSSWAGMGPYASEIVNSFKPEDDVLFFLVEDERRYFSNAIAEKMRKKGIILFRKNSNANKLRDLFYPSKEISGQLIRFCEDNDIQTIHFLTSEVPYEKTIALLSKKYRTFFSVHDLHPHEAKKSFHKMFRHKLMYKKLGKIRETVNNLLTNSKTQEEELKQMFPQKNICYFEFPSLVNDCIINGESIPPELEGVSGYVLYFGRIEQYKGVDLAYKAFTEYTSLKNKMLVIAGSGSLYFQRELKKEDNVIIINRYIKDEEIAYLFRNATITLYPYISATQSGVLSLSCFFGKPIVASDVPFFKSVSEYGLGVNFNVGDIDSLIESVLSLLNGDLISIVQHEKDFYETHYSKESLRNNLLSIYRQ